MQENNRRMNFRQNRKKKLNKLLNILIGIVLLLIIVVVVNIVTDDNTEEATVEKNISDTKEAQEDTEEEKPTDQEEEDSFANESDTQNELSTASSTEEEDTTADTSGGNNDSSTTEESSSDSNDINATVDPTWEPVGTTQTGEHVSSYDKSSVDWAEKVEALAYAAELDPSNMFVKFLGNGGSPQKSIGTVTSKDGKEIYRIHLEWVDGQGWKPTKREKLSTLEDAS